MTEERLKDIEYALNQSRVIEGDDLSSEMGELIAEVRRLQDEHIGLCAALAAKGDEVTDLRDKNQSLRAENAALKDLAAKACQESHDYAVLLREARHWVECTCNPEYNCPQCKLFKRIDAALGDK